MAVHKWQTIYEWLIRQIQNGDLPTHARLPSIRQLAQLFSVSVITVKRAIAELEVDAYVRSVPRSGYFINPISGDNRIEAESFHGVKVDVNQAVVQMLAVSSSEDVYSFNSAVLHQTLVPNVLLNKCMATLLQHVDTPMAGFIAPPGLASLRRKIARLMLARGVVCGSDDILVTSGDTVGLELALMAVAVPGATVAVEMPAYYGILQTIEAVNLRALPIRTDSKTGIDLEHLATALERAEIGAIVLNPSLQNPLGFVMPQHHRERVAQLAAAAKVPIIEDDVFYDLLPPVNRPDAIKSFGDPDNTIYCSSFSKTITPGYRVGWCVPGRYRQAILAQLFSRNLSVSSLAQYVLAEFLKRDYLEDHCRILRNEFSKTIELLTDFIAIHFPLGTVYIPPQGGFVHWVTLPSSVDIKRFRSLMITNNSYVADSKVFYADNQTGYSFRLCLGTRLTHEVKKALYLLAECAHKALIV